MTDHTPDPDPGTMARILALITEVHAEVCGPGRPERHLRAVGSTPKPPAAPVQLAEVLQFPQRRAGA